MDAHPFEQQLFARISEYVQAWTPEERADTYVAALTLGEQFSVEFGEPEWTPFGWERPEGKEAWFQNVFGFAHNTYKHLQEQIPKHQAEPEEYKWMMQAWKDYGADTPARDLDELRLFHDWCAAQRVPPGRERDGQGFPVYEPEPLAQAVIALAVRVVRQMHERGLVTVPVLIFNVHDGLELRATRHSNSAPLLQEFEAFCTSWFMPSHNVSEQ